MPNNPKRTDVVTTVNDKLYTEPDDFVAREQLYYQENMHMSSNDSEQRDFETTETWMSNELIRDKSMSKHPKQPYVITTTS
jgi:hypothetical protein